MYPIVAEAVSSCNTTGTGSDDTQKLLSDIIIIIHFTSVQTLLVQVIRFSKPLSTRNTRSSTNSGVA
jgi:hypothetical protein